MKKRNWLVYISLLMLILGIFSLSKSDSVQKKYEQNRNSLLNKIDANNLSTQQINEIGNIVKEINNRFHTSEYVEVYQGREGNVAKNANYSFPKNSSIKNNFLTEAFYPIETFKGKNFYVVHQYFPDWYFLFPIFLFSLSAIFLIIWTVLQVKDLLNLKFGFK